MLVVARKEIPCMRGLIKVNDARATLRLLLRPDCESYVLIISCLSLSFKLIAAACRAVVGIRPLNFATCDVKDSQRVCVWHN